MPPNSRRRPVLASRPLPLFITALYIIGGINCTCVCVCVCVYIYCYIYCTFITTFITCTFLCICHLGARNHKTICNKIKCKQRSNIQTEYCIQYHRLLTTKKTKRQDTTITLTQPQWQIPRLIDCIMVTSVSGCKLMSVSTHLIVTSYLSQVSQKITYLHVYQLKVCKHFSSLLYDGILSSFTYTVFIRDWNYHYCYLFSKINTVISWFISMSTISQVSPDNVATSWKSLHKYTSSWNCICDLSVVIWTLWFSLYTWHMTWWKCQYNF